METPAPQKRQHNEDIVNLVTPGETPPARKVARVRKVGPQEHSQDSTESSGEECETLQRTIDIIRAPTPREKAMQDLSTYFERAPATSTNTSNDLFADCPQNHCYDDCRKLLNRVLVNAANERLDPEFCSAENCPFTTRSLFCQRYQLLKRLVQVNSAIAASTTKGYGIAYCCACC